MRGGKEPSDHAVRLITAILGTTWGDSLHLYEQNMNESSPPINKPNTEHMENA